MMWRASLWETPLPAAECRARLEHHAVPDTLSGVTGVHPEGTIFASVGARSFRLRARGRPFVRNSFEPYFYGTIVDAGGGTRIRGRFRMHTLVLAFMTFWFLAVIAIGGVATGMTLYQLATGELVVHGNVPPVPGLLIIPAMLAGGAGITLLGWRMGRRQHEALRRFLETTLEAHPADGAPR